MTRVSKNSREEKMIEDIERTGRGWTVWKGLGMGLAVLCLIGFGLGGLCGLIVGIFGERGAYTFGLAGLLLAAVCIWIIIKILDSVNGRR
jgi:hypothetical protein